MNKFVAAFPHNNEQNSLYIYESKRDLKLGPILNEYAE